MACNGHSKMKKSALETLISFQVRCDNRDESCADISSSSSAASVQDETADFSRVKTSEWLHQVE